MTVLIAAAGSEGRTARDHLTGRGFDVEHVTSLAAARVRAATVDVVVAGALLDATAADLRASLRETSVTTPLVHLGADEMFQTTVERPLEADDLETAVRLATQAGAYRQAVDDLYERCRARAAAGDEAPSSDEAVADAKRRAERAFRRTRGLDDRPPFEQLFESATAGATTDWIGGAENDGESSDS